MNSSTTRKRSWLAAALMKAFSVKGAFTVMLTAFIYGLCPVGSVNPFAIAFLLGTDGFPLPVFVGALFSCVFAGQNAPAAVALTVSAAAVKFFVRAKKGYIPTPLMILMSLACGVVLTLSAFWGAQRTLLVFAQAAASSAAVPLFAFLYAGLTEGSAPLGIAHKTVARIACCFTFACAFSVVRTGDFSLGAVWSLALTLFYAYRVAKLHPYRAMAAGCAVGFVCALACNNSVFFAPLGLCGLCAGFLFASTKYYAVIFSLAVSVLLTVISGGHELLGVALIHAALAVPVFAALMRLPEPTLLLFGEDMKEIPKDGGDGKVIANLESSFSSLSRALTVEETGDALRPLGNGVRDGGLARTAQEYMDFSRLLSSLRIRAEQESTEDEETAEKVALALRTMDIRFRRVSVHGTRPTVIDVYDVDVTKLACTTKELVVRLGRTVGKRLSEPEFTVTNDCTAMRLTALHSVRVQYSQSTRAKRGEQFNGDTTDVFSDRHTFFALIGDGMGSGSEASVVSRLSCMFLEKLLMLGADRQDALMLLNKILIKREGECFSGMDLFELDLCDGTAVLMKAGGASSFAVRNGKVSPLSARSSPLGILETVTFGKIRLRLRRGDYLIMVSDGAIGNGGEEEMCNFLSSMFNETATPSAAAIAVAVSERESGDDDTSVIAIKLV